MYIKFPIIIEIICKYTRNVQACQLHCLGACFVGKHVHFLERSMYSCRS